MDKKVLQNKISFFIYGMNGARIHTAEYDFAFIKDKKIYDFNGPVLYPFRCRQCGSYGNIQLYSERGFDYTCEECRTKVVVSVQSLSIISDDVLA